jgi:energy-converting hydrogenase Eha subunit H
VVKLNRTIDKDPGIRGYLQEIERFKDSVSSYIAMITFSSMLIQLRTVETAERLAI